MHSLVETALGAQSRGPSFDFSDFVGQKGSAYVETLWENNAFSQKENLVKLGKLIKFSKFASLNKTIQLIFIQTCMVWQLDIWCVL